MATKPDLMLSYSKLIVLAEFFLVVLNMFDNIFKVDTNPIITMYFQDDVQDS